MSIEDTVAICESIARYSYTYDSPTHQTRDYQSGALFEELTADIVGVRTMLLLTWQEAVDAAPLLLLTGVYHDNWCKTVQGGVCATVQPASIEIRLRPTLGLTRPGNADQTFSQGMS